MKIFKKTLLFFVLTAMVLFLGGCEKKLDYSDFGELKTVTEEKLKEILEIEENEYYIYFYSGNSASTNFKKTFLGLVEDIEKTIYISNLSEQKVVSEFDDKEAPYLIHSVNKERTDYKGALDIKEALINQNPKIGVMEYEDFSENFLKWYELTSILDADKNDFYIYLYSQKDWYEDNTAETFKNELFQILKNTNKTVYFYEIDSKSLTDEETTFLNLTDYNNVPISEYRDIPKDIPFLLHSTNGERKSYMGVESIRKRLIGEPLEYENFANLQINKEEYHKKIEKGEKFYLYLYTESGKYSENSTSFKNEFLQILKNTDKKVYIMDFNLEENKGIIGDYYLSYYSNVFLRYSDGSGFLGIRQYQGVNLIRKHLTT